MNKINNTVCLFLTLLVLSGCGKAEEMPENPILSAESVSEMAQVSTETTDTWQATDVSQQTEASGEGAATSETPAEDTCYDFTLCFAGDVNLDDTWCTVVHMNQQENGILDCISPELVKYMQDADVMCLNHEFTFSTGGTPLAGKAYCFQANPDKVDILETLGVDAVSLANNHTYDYGAQSLVQTLETLENAGISYVGAGRNLEEATEPVYFELDGKVVSIVAGSRAEKNKKTPQATEKEPGILRCYDTALLKETIAEAKANSDYCILFVHWGTEYSTKLEDVQIETGREYLDAGADVIIGAHSHCLQGLEYVDGKPIIYSLGNYWFNERTMDTMLVNLRFYGDADEEHLEVQIIPALQENYETHYVSDPVEQRAMYDRLEDISVNVEISDSGVISQRMIEAQE